MSYSFLNPCPSCKKNDKCTDSNVISGAIGGIHSMPYGVGHLGAGTITLDCQLIDKVEGE